MKKTKQTIVLLLFVLYIVAFQNANAQNTVILQNGFESNSYNGWTQQGTDLTNDASAQGELPSSYPFQYEGGWALTQANNSLSGYVTSPVLSLAGYTDIQLSFKIMAYGNGILPLGLDANDSIIVESIVAPNTVTRQLVITGRKNCGWRYGALMNAVTSYGTLKIVAPKISNGGDITSTYGIGCAIINDIPASNNIKFKITLKTTNNNAYVLCERWIIDDIRITGRAVPVSMSPPANVSGCNGSVINGVNEPVGIKFTWTNSNPSIGLAASGYGNVPSFNAINTTGIPQTATITITPSKNKLAFVTNQLSDSVKVINQYSNSVVSAFATGNNTGPEGMVVAPDDSFLFVACPKGYSGNKQLSKYNIESQTLTSTTVNDDYGLSRLVYNAQNDRLYSGGVNPVYDSTEIGKLGNFNANDLTVNSNNLGLIKDMVLSADGNLLYCIHQHNAGLFELRIYNTSNFSIVDSILGGFNDPRAMALSPDGSRLYITDMGAGEVAVFDARNAKKLGAMSAGGGHVGMAVDPKGRYIYVTDSLQNHLKAISTSNELDQFIYTGTHPAYLAISNDGDKLFVPNYGSNDVMIYNTSPMSLAATISNIGNGPYLIKTSGSDGNAVTYTITVNPTPTLSSSLSLTRCNNQPATYTATSATPGTTFTWSRAAVSGISNTAANGTGATITETLNNTTPYTLFVNYAITLTANGCSNTQNVMVIVNALSTPTFTLNPASPSICPGNSIVINASNASHTYSWTPATALNATTGLSVTANPTASTVYTVTATHTNGCTNTKTANVTVSCPKPTGMVANNITNNSAQINWNDITCALSFKIQYRIVGAGSWNSINNVVDTFKVLTGLTASTAYEYQIATKCPIGTFGKYSAKKQFTTLALREEEISGANKTLEFEMDVFPNPAQSEINISFNNIEDGNATLRLHDAKGTLVFEKQIVIANGEYNKSLDLSTYQPGIYMLQMVKDGTVKSVKVVKE